MRIRHRSLGRIVGLGAFTLSALLALLVVHSAASQAPDTNEPKWRTGYLPMPDGVKLAYILHRPRKDGQFPVLLNYNGGLGGATVLGPEEREYLRAGYAVLGVSIRGTGSSEGVFTTPFAPQEGEDGKAVVEWAGQQPWCDGNVGMYGNSYAGIPPLEVAAQRPKYLKALAVGGVWGDTYEDICYPGGIFNFGQVGQWSFQTQPYLSIQSARLREFTGDLEGAKRRAADPAIGKVYQEMRAHPFNDSWWALRSFEDLAPQIETPTLLFQAWQDPQVGARGALQIFRKLKGPKRILLSNGGDGTYSAAAWIAERVRWFDRWLKGKQNGVDKDPPVTIWFETRDPNPQVVQRARSQATPSRLNLKPAWVSTFSTWPIPEVRWSTLYLTADGKLNNERPATEKDSGQRFYLYPAGTELVSTNEMFSAPPAPVGSLIYRSVPLPEDLAIIGSPVLTLYVSSEQKDTDFMAVLHDVNPKGQVTYVQRGFLRLSHRALDPKKSTPHEPIHSHDKSEELTPGQAPEIKFSLFPVGHVLRRGHALELALMAPPSVLSPSWGFVPVTPPGLNTIYHSAKQPSRLELPVVPKLQAQSPAPPVGSLPLQPAREEVPKGAGNQRKELDEILRAWKQEKLDPVRK